MNRQRPQDLVFTLFGEYLLPRAEPVWAGSLISLLGPLEVSEGVVRTTLSRMSRKGWFDTVRVGRRSFYQLSARGRALLEEGRDRIYHPSWDEPWDRRWLLLAYSIPEERRELRDRLRDRLGWLGFGALGNGLWISPHDVEEQVLDIATALGIEEHLECFHAQGAALTEPARLVARCWDLASLNRRYEAFVARHVPLFQELRQLTARESTSARRCYVRRFQLSHEFREFPLIDPYLPRSLLPESWAGECAAALFQSYHDLLTEPADRYVESVLTAAGTPSASGTTVRRMSETAAGRRPFTAQRRPAR